MRCKKSVIHIRLSEQVHRQLKITCVKRGETIQAFVERAIQQALGRADRLTTSFAVAEGSAQHADASSVGDTEDNQAPADSGQPVATQPRHDSTYLDTEGLTDDEAEVLRVLSEVDWTFEHADTQEHAHGLHPYPARFIPQIPRKLIDALHPRDGSATLDPFCGSGTTLLESILLGIPAIGVDVNPLAVLIARVKTTPLDEPLDQAIATIVRQAYSRLNDARPVTVPDIPRLSHWFQPEIARAVAILVQEIRRAEVDDASRDALRAALSGILVRVSNQESDVRYAAIDKRVAPEEVIVLFERNARAVSRKLSSISQLPLFPELQPAHATVLQADTRALHISLPSWRVGLIVTSPPYPNAYEYWLYHKYRMYWLGMDPIAARTDEIGARAHYSKKNGLTAEDFADDMRQCFRGFSGLLPSGRHACFVIGNSRIRGTHVDNGALLTRVAQEHGFRLRARFPRRIPSTRKAFNPALGSIGREVLLIFRRE